LRAVFAPTTFGKYYLYEKVEGGGMAEIYRAKLLGPAGFEKRLIIKQIKAELARDQRFVELFVDEAKVTVQLTHGNIVPVFELGKVDGTYFIAMELVDGPALGALLRRGRALRRSLGTGVAVHIAIEVLKGLDYAHRQRVVHRDLSPGNVLVSRQGEVKIVDFGLATAAARLEPLAIAGSVAYMSPEQAAGGAVDPRSDLFSCGVLLWEMLAGRPLWGGTNDVATLAQVQACEVGPPSTAGAEVAAELDAIVVKALARDPGQRYGRAAEMLAELVRFTYARDALVSQDDLGRVVRELYPPEQSEAPEGASDAPATSPTPALGVPMVAKASEVTFAKSVTFEREVLTKLSRVAEPLATGATKPLVERSIRSRGPRVVALALLAAGVVGAAAVIAYRNQTGAATPMPTHAAPIARPADPVDAAAPPMVGITPDAAAPPPRPRPPRPVRGPAPHQAAAAQVAHVTLNATPWADFYLDGHKLAGCPVRALPVAAGDHELRIVCEGHERTEPLHAAVGEIKRVFDCGQPGIPVVGP
jgi:serine/threonine protein kinase